MFQRLALGAARKRAAVTAAWPWQAAGGLVAGAALAWLFLQALRHSVERLPGRPHPGRWVLAGFVLRVVLVVAGFALVAQVGRAPGLAAALVGFLAARTWVLQRARRQLAGERQARAGR